MKKLFLFDFDGVVVDSLELYEGAVNACLEQIGAPPISSREEFLDLFEGNFYEGIIRRGIDILSFTGASAEIAPLLDYARVKPKRELIPVLEQLQKTNILSIVSSNSSVAVGFMLEQHGFRKFFKGDVLGYEFTFSKVDKIEHAVESYGISKDLSYYICDTTGDVLEAREAGVRAVAVTWGWHSRERLERVSPEFLVSTPAELLSI